jgi:hypothetical protein
MKKWITAGILRALLAFSGGVAVATDEQLGAAVRSLMEALAADASGILGLVVTVAVGAWSVYDKRKKQIEKETK